MVLFKNIILNIILLIINYKRFGVLIKLFLTLNFINSLLLKDKFTKKRKVILLLINIIKLNKRNELIIYCRLREFKISKKIMVKEIYNNFLKNKTTSVF